MAVDTKEIINNLTGFYKFYNKKIISVGAGGGQLIGYAHSARQVVAVDIDKKALDALEKNLQRIGLSEKFKLIHSDFYLFQGKSDVVLFEFCLHEMKNPEKAINRAIAMAPDIFIYDHLPDSEWAYIADEREKVTDSWEAINKFTLKETRRYDTVQFFHDYEELYQKVKVQGENTINRIQQFKDKKDFTIPMSYGFALIKQDQ